MFGIILSNGTVSQDLVFATWFAADCKAACLNHVLAIHESSSGQRHGLRWSVCRVRRADESSPWVAVAL